MLSCGMVNLNKNAAGGPSTGVIVMQLRQPTDNEAFTGWQVGKVFVPAIAAYTSGLDWFNDFLWRFPEKEKRMREYSKKQGWTNVVFARYWMPVVVVWLNKNHA